ncbi:OLC1v1000997C1 [Oldenlandia corymbosa var. corymbosa]|uniref:OLC1v1000997C1 n=1 Tax=Oldenlandia corymbosa var. corymbosa TaxID=529605 RepID=A0AAV1D6M7_OLDCO|nr:OLC1v1000997C1 [Oldenlandia corymbosa var. corymbosa]
MSIATGGDKIPSVTAGDLLNYNVAQPSPQLQEKQSSQGKQKQPQEPIPVVIIQQEEASQVADPKVAQAATLLGAAGALVAPAVIGVATATATDNQATNIFAAAAVSNTRPPIIESSEKRDMAVVSTKIADDNSFSSQSLQLIDAQINGQNFSSPARESSVVKEDQVNASIAPITQLSPQQPSADIPPAVNSKLMVQNLQLQSDPNLPLLIVENSNLNSTLPYSSPLPSKELSSQNNSTIGSKLNPKAAEFSCSPRPQIPLLQILLLISAP